MKARDWYFRGWERQPDGQGKTKLVYVGEYYRFPGGVKRPKIVCGALTAALTALYLIVALRPTAGGMWHIAAIPQLLALIPLIYLIMGAVCLAFAPEKLTYRDYHASWRRISRSAVGCVVITGAMAAVELVYIFMSIGGQTALGPEFIYLLGELGCLALSLCLLLFVKKHPCSQSQ